MDWDLHLLGDKTMLSERSCQRETGAGLAGEVFTLTFSPGNFQKSRRSG